MSMNIIRLCLCPWKHEVTHTRIPCIPSEWKNNNNTRLNPNPRPTKTDKPFNKTHDTNPFNLPILSVIWCGAGLGLPAWAKRMFCGFRSRCTIPLPNSARMDSAVEGEKKKTIPISIHNTAKMQQLNV